MIGLALFDDWVQGVRRSANMVEQLLSIAVVGTIAWVGLLQGVGVGLVAAGAIFIVRYSRVDPVRSASNGGTLRSRIDRPPHEVRRLRAAGHQLVVIELQGFLFFGSLTALEDRLRQVAATSAHVGILVLDFSNVTGIDDSGCETVVRLLHEVQREGVDVWVSAIDPRARKALTARDPGLAARAVFLNSLSAALETARGPPVGRANTTDSPTRLQAPMQQNFRRTCCPSA